MNNVPHFSDLSIGDMFNTKAARWVKTSDTEAICVGSSMYPIGEIKTQSDDLEVVVLYSSSPKIVSLWAFGVPQSVD